MCPSPCHQDTRRELEAVKQQSVEQQEQITKVEEERDELRRSVAERQEECSAQDGGLSQLCPFV